MSTGAIRIVHVTPHLTLGGAGRALIATAKYSARLGRVSHRAVSLMPPDPAALALANEARFPVAHMRLNENSTGGEFDDADILQIHFWNHPALRRFIERGIPAVRTILWCHTPCVDAPHILTQDVFDRSDVVLASIESTMQMQMFAGAEPGRLKLVKAGADFERLAGFQAQPHHTFNVGYVGLFDFMKLHADFVAMSAAISVPNVRVLAYGEGPHKPVLLKQVRQLAADERIVFGSYVFDLRPVLAEFDVFGYPLCEDNVATAELVLQEVMRAGIPPVVLPYGGPARVVVHGETGLIARDAADYVRLIEYLYHHPAERKRLGQNAARRAVEIYGAKNTARQMNAVYADVMTRLPLRNASTEAPNRSDLFYNEAKTQGSRSFVESLGGQASDFQLSLSSFDEEVARAADSRISKAKTGVGDTVLLYRKFYPDDSYLRLWSGLILWQRNHVALAAAEFKASISQNGQCLRAYDYLADTAWQAGSHVIADWAIETSRAILASVRTA